MRKKYCVKKKTRAGRLGDMVNPMTKSIWNIARTMRVRPEEVFQLISDAFDRCVREASMIEDEDGLHFETDIAAFTLVPCEGESYLWELQYKAKEAMINWNLASHPKEVYTVPAGFGNHVLIPSKEIDRLRDIVEGCEQMTNEEIYDHLDAAYKIARIKGKLQIGEEYIRFDSLMLNKSGEEVCVGLVPNYLDPIPNMWRLVASDALPEQGSSVSGEKAGVF